MKKLYCLLSAGVALLLYFGWPHVMVAREQSLLFLWTGSYFLERIAVPGGLAQYLAELLVQFFGSPVIAAAIYGGLCLTGLPLFSLLKKKTSKYLLYLLPMTIFLLALDYYIPLTLTVAILITLFGIARVSRLGYWSLLLIPVSYWLVGPVAVCLLLPLLLPQGGGWTKVCLGLLLFGSTLLFSVLILPYPFRQVVRGIDYYWEEQHPSTHEEMACDMLLRMKQWDAIADQFQQSESPAIQNAVWLARFQNKQIGETELRMRMNLSNQTLRSQSSAFIMSEIYIQIGMPQMSQRCAFEAMEAVPNHNKSGRALRRLVETNLITGNTDVALKYISILEHTSAFSGFAQKMKDIITPNFSLLPPYYEELRKIYINSHDTFF